MQGRFILAPCFSVELAPSATILLNHIVAHKA